MSRIVLYTILIKICTCNEENSIENTNLLPSFRKQVEEFTIEKPLISKTDEATNNLVTFLVKNAKKLYNALEETTVLLESFTASDKSALALKKTISTNLTNKEKDKLSKIVDEKDLSFVTATDKKIFQFGKVIDAKSRNEYASKSTELIKTNLILTTNTTTVHYEMFRDFTDNAKILNVSKDIIVMEKQAQKENQALDSILPLKTSKLEKERARIDRSCIFCNNVAIMECYDPKNKLIPSLVCEHDEDLCYSLHTPFGIVDRGCFNVNHDLSTYVCACNLCNYISISEMPYIFSTKRDWVENVIELSRTRRLRQSVLKDMSCLRCEINVSTITGDMLDNANCLEGNVGTLPIQECSENEICGVKAIRSEGYVWRGCVTKPLYNYWWTLCDSDLCNYDSLVSIYDEL